MAKSSELSTPGSSTGLGIAFVPWQEVPVGLKRLYYANVCVTMLPTFGKAF